MTTNVASLNDDLIGTTAPPAVSSMTTNEIDLSTAPIGEDLFFVMRSYFPNRDWEGLDERALIDVSTDGMTWTEIGNLDGGDAGSYSYVFFDFTAYAGGSVWLRFTYDDGMQWNFGWAMDDITIIDEITFADQKDYALHAGYSVMMDEAIEGIEYLNEGYIFNYGWETITSFDVSMTDGTNTIMTSVTGANIPYNSASTYKMSETVTVSGDKTWTVSISNVNGVADADADASDNTMDFNLNAIDNAHPDRGILFEEATGTWCQWCTRGAVFMDEVAKRIGKHFVGVAVHNGENDPMLLEEYDDNMNVGGYPSGIYQRGDEVDPGAIVTPVLEDIQVAPAATLLVGASMTGGVLTTSLAATTLEDLDGDYSLSIVVVENGMTEATHDIPGAWNQINAYAGGGNGPMGGYELLGASVPGDLMTYNHVGRGLIGGFDGVEIPELEDLAAGQTVGYTFDDYDVPTNLNTDHMKLIGLLLDDDGEVVNAISTSLSDAMDNGLFVAVSNKEVIDNNLAEVRPTLVKDITSIYMSMEEAKDISVSVVNTVGQTMSSKDFGSMSGQFKLDYDLSGLATGVYMMHIKAGDTIMIKKVNKID